MFCFLRLRRPPRATAFPYTPLCRSAAPIQPSHLTPASGALPAAAAAIRLSRRTLRTIKQNLGWAFGYNVAALPLAAAGLLNPLLAGLAMALSSVSVVANALRLRRDRKSTRLNSSHANISYAVFCLKTK